MIHQKSYFMLVMSMLTLTSAIHAAYLNKYARWEYECIARQYGALREYRQTRLQPSQVILKASHDLVAIAEQHIASGHNVDYCQQLKRVAIQEIERQQILVEQYSKAIREHEEHLDKRASAAHALYGPLFSFW